MSLITCTDCQMEISDKATACPSCGCPVAGTGGAAPSKKSDVRTIEQTGKRWKAQQMLATLLTLVGVAMLSAAFGFTPDDPSGAMVLGGILATVVGFLWYILARSLAWWNHG